VKSLPKLIDKATNRDLTGSLRDHLEETKNQIARLNQVFKKLGQEPEGVKCPAIDGLISEADEVGGRLRTRMSGMQPLWGRHRPSSITRWRAMEP
jgi:ferritin-like metal-binding protein YciE